MKPPPSTEPLPHRRASDAVEDDADARVSSREALRFLTRAGRVLSASLDPDQTLRRLVRLAVPRVACFAMIDLLRGDGRLERVAWSHIDEEKQPLLVRPEPFEPGREGIVPLERVLAAGEAVMIESVARDWPGSEAIRERLQRIGGRSLIVVPLAVRGETLGTLTFGSTRTDRFYGSADLSLARELARSAGLALDNARLYSAAQQAIASRDEVLAVVSHDLRNPVNRVRMAAELVAETGGVPDEARRMMGMVTRAADEMNRLIGDLLDVAKVEAGTLSIEPAPVSVGALLARLDEAHAAAAAEKPVRWHVEPPARAPTLHADEDRLLQALGNLVGNALKFTPPGGEVRVAAAESGGRVRIGVIDTGPGMDEAQLAHVFDRFWQGRAGDRRGAGLGLAIARGIAEAHGGRLWLESEVGVGTSAWLEVPVE